jgi:RTX calcium-binding nonapeptide repeat (4 copies)
VGSGGWSLRDQGLGLRTSRRFIGTAVLVLLAAVVVPASAGATEIAVNGFGENATCSLRAAIYDANHDANVPDATCPVGSGTDTITLAAGTYNLSAIGSGDDADLSGDLDITSNLSIEGQAAGQTTIQWDGSVNDADRDRVLDVHSIDANTVTAMISAVTVSGGRTPATDSGGTVPGEGIGVRVLNQGAGATTLVLDHSALQGNIGLGGVGGGMAVDTGATGLLDKVLVGDAAIGSNTNLGGVGGGLLNLGTMSLDRTTIAGNLSDRGGGIFNQGTLSAVNSTISSNQANGTDINSGGGAIYSGGGALKLSNVTADGNTTDDSGGAGLQVESGTATVKNTILADSVDSGASAIPDCSGAITSQGHNVIEQNSCTGTLPSDLTGPGSDPSLGPLQDNGASVLTQLPGAGSPAVDIVPTLPGSCTDVDSNPVTSDERGTGRPQPAGGSCDAGAVERDQTPPNTTITSGPNGSTNDPTPRFAFNSSEPNSTFQCKVDSASFASCASPKTLAHLNDGSHTFRVSAVDSEGNPDATPATRTVNVQTASVSLSGSRLLVSAATGAKDDFAITKPSGTTIRITDLPAGAFTGSGVHTGTGCTRVGDFTANCGAAGVSTVVILSADMPDKITSSTAMKTSLNGGGSSDMLLGGPGPDTLIGGPAADVMKGMNGNDALQARDGVADTTLNCDGGTSPAANDSADMDKLPKDSKVTGCEHQTRH